MNDPIRPNDLITLRHNIQEQNLSQGRLGRVLQVFSPDEFEVEFTDKRGSTVAKIRLKLEQVEVLHYQATLNETDFWKLIEDAKIASDGNSERQVELNIDTLSGMSIADIFMFRDLFHKIQGGAYQRELWAAAEIICGGCGNDDFMDFRAWLIAQGEKVFYDALHDPETLIDFVQLEQDETGIWGNAVLEKMNYVSYEAYKKKTGEEMPLFSGIYTPPKLMGKNWDDIVVSEKYPKLVAKFRSDS